MRTEQKRGIRYSGTMHAVLLILLIVGLPNFLFPPPEIDEPAAITVDILPISALTNVRPSQNLPVKDEPKPKEEKKPEIVEKTLAPVKPEKEKPSPMVKTEDDKPAPPPEPTEPDDNTVKKEENEKKPDEQKKEDDPLDAILKSVKDTAAAEQQENTETDQKEETSSSSRSRSTNFDPNSPESMAIRDAIQSQIYKCWNVPAGARNAEELIVPLEIDYDDRGFPIKIELAKAQLGRYKSDTFFRAAVDSAVRAVRACAPLQGLPPETYHIWRYVDMNFNPRDMLF